MIPRLSAAMIIALPLCCTPASAQQDNAWAQEKCSRYERAWGEALQFFGTDGLNYAFIAGNENFIASGCTERTAICPRSIEELDIANALTIAAMNAGAASTFVPFACDSGVRGN